MNVLVFSPGNSSDKPVTEANLLPFTLNRGNSVWSQLAPGSAGERSYIIRYPLGLQGEIILARVVFDTGGGVRLLSGASGSTTESGFFPRGHAGGAKVGKELQGAFAALKAEARIKPVAAWNTFTLTEHFMRFLRQWPEAKAVSK